MTCTTADQQHATTSTASPVVVEEDHLDHLSPSSSPSKKHKDKLMMKTKTMTTTTTSSAKASERSSGSLASSSVCVPVPVDVDVSSVGPSICRVADSFTTVTTTTTTSTNTTTLSSPSPSIQSHSERMQEQDEQDETSMASDSLRSGRSVSIHGGTIFGTASFRVGGSAAAATGASGKTTTMMTMMMMDGADSSSIATPTSLTNGHADRTVGCFFPDHKVLKGDFPAKVVKYARRRLAKAKVRVGVNNSSSNNNNNSSMPTTITTIGSSQSSPSSATSSATSSSTVPQWTHDQIVLDELLGEGSFSSVYSVKEIQGGTFNPDQVVVKVLRKKLLKNPPMLAACAADLVKEGILLQQLQGHDHILALIGNAYHGVDAYGISGRHDAYYLVLGKLETTLADKLKQWRLFQITKGHGWKVFKSPSTLQQKWESFQQRMNVLDQLGEAIVYLHSQHVLHRDLKPDNIGFDHQGVLKVFDFDVARILPTSPLMASTSSTATSPSTSPSASSPSPSPSVTFQMTKRVGSPRYMSPECARGEPYNATADVYTFALLVHELYSLEKPYEDIPSELHDELVFYQGSRPFLPKSWPQLFRQALERAWNERVSLRPSMAELQQSWIHELKPIVLADKQRKYTKSPWNNKAGNTATLTFSSSSSSNQAGTTTTVIATAMGTNGTSTMSSRGIGMPPSLSSSSTHPSSPIKGNHKKRAVTTSSHKMWESARTTVMSSSNETSESFSLVDPIILM